MRGNKIIVVFRKRGGRGREGERETEREIGREGGREGEGPGEERETTSGSADNYFLLTTNHFEWIIKRRRVVGSNRWHTAPYHNYQPL